MILLHLGDLHPYEKALTLVLAFGPFLLLALVAVLRGRQDRREEQAEEHAQEPARGSAPGPAPAQRDR